MNPARPAEFGANPLPGGPIGIFDSGIGGLTVAAAVLRELPGTDILYVGDTARVPYGGRSRETVERYSLEIGGMLAAEGARCIVVACNTASALALDCLRANFSIPVVGVVEPGAAAAAIATRTGKIGIIGTRGTIGSGAYVSAIHRLLPDAEIYQVACPLLVPLIEEGWNNDPVTLSILHRYLDPLMLNGIDTLVLGCTHYPLAKDAISAVAGSGVCLVDSAQNCACAVRELLETADAASAHSRRGELRVVLTDPANDFLRVATDALQIEPAGVEIRRL